MWRNGGKQGFLWEVRTMRQNLSQKCQFATWDLKYISNFESTSRIEIAIGLALIRPSLT